MRIDKWLWAARFFKTRALATDELDRGRVQINGQDVKPARDVKPGDMVRLRQGTLVRTVEVKGLSMQRGSAPVAQLLYAETAESLQLKARTIEHQRLNAEPAGALIHGRPTKRDRRDIDKVSDTGWNQRWSASVD